MVTQNQKQLGQALAMSYLAQLMTLTAKKTSIATYNNFTLDSIEYPSEKEYKIKVLVPKIDEAKAEIHIDKEVVDLMDTKSLYESFGKGINSVNIQTGISTDGWLEVIIECEDEDSDAKITHVSSSFANDSTNYVYSVTSANSGGTSYHKFKDERIMVYLRPLLTKAFNIKYAKIFSLENFSKFNFVSYNNSAYILRNSDLNNINLFLNDKVWKENFAVINALKQRIEKSEKTLVHKETKSAKSNLDDGNTESISVLEIAQKIYDIYNEFDNLTLLNMITKMSKTTTIRNNDVRKSLQLILPSIINELDSKYHELGKPIRSYVESLKNAKLDEVQELHKFHMKNLYDKTVYIEDRLIAAYNLIKVLAQK